MTPAPALVADIGGTNTRLALAEGARLRPGSIRRFRNAGFPGIEAVIESYLAEAGLAADGRALSGVCMAAAGMVQDNAVTMTNLNWVITGEGLARATGCAGALLLNDLQAQGHALDHLPEGNMTRVLVPAHPVPERATQLVIGVGTGFNAAPVHRTPAGARMVVASESGHVGLPASDAQGLRLAAHVARHHGFASVEDVLSGRGLGHVDAWLADEAGAPGTERDSAALMAALAEGEPRAEAAAQVFVRTLGAVAGDLALIHLPYGGIYLAGGIARAFAPYLARFRFAESFCAKGRFSGFVAQFPVAVIEDDYAALIGCAACLAAE